MSSCNCLSPTQLSLTQSQGWLRDETRKKEDVLQHLEDENAYTEALTSHLEPLRNKLYQEMLSSIQETDYAVPRPHDNWWYYTRTIEGKSYTVHCRAPKTTSSFKVEWNGTEEAPILPDEEILLDVNQLAEGHSYCSTGNVRTSPSHKLLAYSVDFVGDEKCQMFVKDLETGETVDHDPKLEISGAVVWGDDDSTLFYLKMDDQHRPYQVYQYTIGAEEKLLWEETDHLHWVHISKSLDGRYLFVDSSSKETSEVHYLDLKDPNATLQCVAKRRTKVLYEVEHRKGTWWITSNVNGTPNMRLLTCPVGPNCEGEWKELVDKDGTPLFDGGYDRSLSDVTAFATHVVASGREGGIPRVWIISLDDAESVQSFEKLTFEEAAHSVELSSHYEFETDSIVLSYDSLITPLQHLEINLSDTSKRTVVKERNVPGYQKSRYDCERITVTARDGTEIPVSLVYRKDVMEEHLKEGKPVHTHLYGYGSYGACIEADFRATRLPLLDRCIVYVIAHVRGGGEMGRQWYEEPNGAKYLCKKNTFNDFVDVARWLIDIKKLTSPELLSCEGRSAGGLLIGASVNQAPELFKMALLGVPFVDVVPTMIDASIPLTSAEWEEWGNPNEEKYHEYMMEYSPINNVQKAKYPSCLLTGGLHDPRVQFWEPAKFAAELRHSQGKDSGPVCVKMDMTAGHFSASDRYKYLKELSFDYAFLLQEMGLADIE